MNTLPTLWLPILLSAAVVFVISSLIHMVFKWHASDYRGFANEDDIRTVLRAANPGAGRYVVPYCSDMKDMAGEAMQRKYREGPIAHVMVGPTGVPNMGKYLGLWFVWCLAIAAAAAALAGGVLPRDPQHVRAAAKLAGAVTFIAHGFGSVTESIWMMRPWSETAKHVLDAALYAIGTALVFYWLWN